METLSVPTADAGPVVQFYERPSQALLKRIAAFHSEEAGWYSTVFELSVCSSRFVIIVMPGDVLAGVASIHGEFTNNYWVGNVVVARKFRRKGLASVLVSALLRKVEQEKGPSTAVLLASPLGVPLYKRLDFSVIPSIVVTEYDRPGMELPERPEHRAYPPNKQDLTAASELYYKCSGMRRDGLLQAIYKRDGICAVLKRNSDMVAAAWGRRTAPLGKEKVRYVFIGPVVACSADLAVIVTAEVLRMEMESRTGCERGEMPLKATVLGLSKDGNEGSRLALEGVGFVRNYDLPYMRRCLGDCGEDSGDVVDFMGAGPGYFAVAGWDLG